MTGGRSTTRRIPIGFCRSHGRAKENKEYKDDKEYKEVLYFLSSSLSFLSQPPLHLPLPYRPPLIDPLPPARDGKENLYEFSGADFKWNDRESLLVAQTSQSVEFGFLKEQQAVMTGIIRRIRCRLHVRGNLHLFQMWQSTEERDVRSRELRVAEPARLYLCSREPDTSFDGFQEFVVEPCAPVLGDDLRGHEESMSCMCHKSHPPQSLHHWPLAIRFFRNAIAPPKRTANKSSAIAPHNG